MLHVLSSTSAARRLDAAHAFLAVSSLNRTILGASRGAADDFARRRASRERRSA